MSELPPSRASRNSEKASIPFGRYLPHAETRARNEYVAALCASGMTAAAAGREVGLERTQARRIARLYGVERRAGRPRNG